ncbi:MAG: MFS transporter [Spirochaetaceae bacterium]|nr:MFS transporter [Spirochaetaceae bacterium]
MLTIAYGLNFVDRQILVILQESIKADMGLADWQLGLLSGFAFAAIYVTAGIPIAWWADRGNRRNVIALAVAVWSGLTALSGLAQSYPQLLLARVGVGLGEAGGSPPAHAMISDSYPPARRATALAIYSAGLHGGIFAGFVLGGVIDEYFGWRAAFLVVGLPGVLFALLFRLTVEEPPRGRFESAQAAAYRPGLRETLALLSGFRCFWWIAAGAGLTSFVGYGVGNFVPSFLVRSHGLGGSELGLVMAFGGGGAGLVGTLLSGRIADHLGVRDRRWYLWVPALAGLAALPISLPFLLLDDTRIVLMAMVLATVLINTYLGPGIAIVHGLVPPAMRALSSAVFFFVLNLIGLGLGPLTAGLLSDRFTASHGEDGLRYALLVVSAIGSLGVLCFVQAARQLPRDLETSERVLASAGAGPA